jgi:hypothetical protein
MGLLIGFSCTFLRGVVADARLVALGLDVTEVGISDDRNAEQDDDSHGNHSEHRYVCGVTPVTSQRKMNPPLHTLSHSFFSSR